MNPRILTTLITLSTIALAQPQLPMGMNIGGASYWSPSPYNDPLRGGGPFFTYYDGGPWDSQQIQQIPVDSNGYPLQIPVTLSGNQVKFRTMVNTCRLGDYQLFKEGDGDVYFNGAAKAREESGKTLVHIDGSCTHGWMDITRSNASNPLRNIRLIPIEYASNPDEAPRFDTVFVHGLRPFHALRFMDWTSTNGSPQSSWSSRAKPTDFSFGTSKGMPIEHAIELSNLLDAHPWFCVPHNADDDFIRQFATLVKTQLKPALRAYVEYSNEVWNWQFSQAHYVGQNGLEITWEGDTVARAADTVRAALAQVGLQFCNDANAYCHPEKDAYMMNRTFKIWKSVYGDEASTRLVRVATAQHAWYDNTGRILSYLFEHGDGADAVSVAGYFNFEEDDHNTWNSMPAASVTPQMILDSVFANFESTSGLWTRESAKFANQYQIDYLVYEGGQHMQPWMQGDYAYNQSVWDAQIHPRMYDLYMKNFEVHTESDVDCKLFMAFAYTGERESRYGSWGHLENYSQSLLSGVAMKTAAPKYQALLDANTPRPTLPTQIIPFKKGIHPPWNSHSSKMFKLNGARISK